MMPNKRLINLVPEAGHHMLMKVVYNWLGLVSGIIMWFVLGKQIQSLYEREGIKAAMLIIAATAIAFRFFFIRISSACTHKAASAVKVKLRSDIFSKLLSIGTDYNKEFSTSEVVQLAGEGVEQLENYFGNYIPQFFYAILAPLTLLVVFIPLSPLTGFVLFFSTFLIPVAIVKVQRFAKKLLGNYWDAYANLGDSFLENLQGLTTLKVYSADQKRHEDMNKESEHFRKVTMKVLTMQLNSVTIMDFVAYGGSAIGCILTSFAFMNGRIDVGEAVFMVMLSAEFFLAMRALGSFFHTAMNGIAASEKIFKLLELPERSEGAIEGADGDITINNLSFSYDEKTILDNINLTIEKGTIVSIVGESGCGKSTLASLISGFRTGYSGKININGAELRTLTTGNLRQLVTVVSNNSYIFSGTVREVLTQGKGNATESEMKEALQKVALWDFISSQGGLDFELKERAGNLSGGQRQRLSLARAILKNSPIYIFDEATSNIDVESENTIMKVINDMRGEHTIILISHRLANVTSSDCIAFMEKGVIKELGEHIKLLNDKKGYYRLYQAQMELESYGKEAAL